MLRAGFSASHLFQTVGTVSARAPLTFPPPPGPGQGELNVGPSPQESLCQPHHILEEEGAPGRGLPHIAAVVHALLERP